MELYDELLQLVVAYSNKQIKYLAQWIIDYKKKDNKKEMDLRLEKTLYINRFRKMAGEYSVLKAKERAARNQELFEYYSAYIKSLIPGKYRFNIDELCYTGRWEEAVASIIEMDEEIEASRFENEYEKLITDSEYLIEQLVTVMKTEYSKRLANTERAMSEYLDPHKTAMERLDRNLEEAGKWLLGVGKSGLSEEDKAEISGELRARIAEMRRMKAREAKKVRTIKVFVNEVKKTYLVFEGIIASIEREKELIEERKRYSGLLGRLEIEASEIDEVFGKLSEELSLDVKKARESMELLTNTFQGKLVDAISDQERVNRMLEPDKPAAAGEVPDERPINRDYYEDILKILKSMES